MTAKGMRGTGLLEGGARFAPEPGLISRLFAPGFAKMVEQVDRGLAAGKMIAHLPDGTTRTLGGRAPGFEAELWLKDWRALIRLATGGSIGWFQAYEAGEWEADDHVSLLALMGANARSLGETARPSGPFRLAAKLLHWLNRNNKAGSVRNISAHYDLGNDFYAQWLDPSMIYSSALGMHDHALEEAQQDKLKALKQRIGAAEDVLEIGCGWGALADHLAAAGAKVIAISLSDQQLAWARAHQRDGIDFRKQDYRDVRGQYDAIVSVEMVEALGRENWPVFMDCVASNLKSGGRAAIQYISMADDLFEDYAASADFIQAYVFPGGMLIKSSEFRALAEERGLVWADQTDFGEDYAETLKEWRNRFDTAVTEGGLPAGFDDRFIRLWRYYLDYCEAGFRCGNVNVHQVTLVKD